MSTDALPKKKNKTRPSTWRDDLPVHPAAELFPLMGEAELRELADDVEKHGLQEKPDIYRDENGKEFLLDGRNQVDALALIGRRAEAFNYLNSRGDGFDPVAYVVSKNVHRRHLTQEQRRDLIAKVLKATPEKSNLQIAKQVKADDKTVAKVRAKLESTSDIPKLKKTKGKDGKSRPVRQKRASRKATRSLAEATPIPEVGTKPDKIIQAEPTSKATGSPTRES